MQMWLCGDKLRGEKSHFRLPSASKTRVLKLPNMVTQTLYSSKPIRTLEMQHQGKKKTEESKPLEKVTRKCYMKVSVKCDPEKKNYM